jgi:hypothetical protein
MFKPETKTVFSVTYREIQNLIDEHYGQAAGFKEEFNIACIEEQGNDTDLEIHVEKGENDKEESEEGGYLTPKNGRYRNYSTQAFLNDLCDRGFIPEGDYLINISW